MGDRASVASFHAATETRRPGPGRSRTARASAHSNAPMNGSTCAPGSPTAA